MGLRMRLSNFPIPLFAFAVIACPTVAAAQTPAPECGVAYAVIAMLLPDPDTADPDDVAPAKVGPDERIVLTAVTNAFPAPPTREDFLGGEWSDTPPPPNLAAAFVADRGADVFQVCPDLQTGLARKGYRFGFTEAARARTEIAAPSKVLVIALSRPVVSATGQEALMTLHIECGAQTCGDGFYLWLHRVENGTWEVFGDRHAADIVIDAP